ncbi:hypothetical protein GCM10028833_16830 [Glycomyces tarimensis]
MGERSHTSDCGNVTVTVSEASAPAIELAEGAVRMFARDLAELVTATARAAADGYMAEATTEADAPSIDDTIAQLERLRGSLDDDGLIATLDAQRAASEDPEERAAREERNFEGVPHLALPQSVVDTLGSTIEVLKRLGGGPAGPGSGAEIEQPVGRAMSPSKLVSVEAAPGYPIATVSLSKRACEIGPRALAAEIETAAAAAVEDLASRQDEFFTGMGLPIGPGDVTQLSQEVKGLGAQAQTDMTTIQRHAEDMTRLLYRGGYFGQR